VVHQSVYELVHSEDREELQRQLTWNSQLASDSGLTLMDALRTENSLLLERSFTVRFRCLLDNTSGFLVSSLPFISVFYVLFGLPLQSRLFIST
jgi:aryl hydrocarbon receptor